MPEEGHEVEDDDLTVLITSLDDDMLEVAEELRSKCGARRFYGVHEFRLKLCEVARAR